MATMTPQEVAIRCNIDERTVYRWIKNGQLDATKVGSRWRVRLPLPEGGLGEDGVSMDDPSTASTPEASSGLGRKLPQAALVRRNDNLIQLATEMAQSAANLPAEELKRHWDILLAVMRPLEGVKILPLEGRHLLPWWENPVGPHRLGALAFVSRGEDGALSVVMSAEITNPVEWGYLQQHLARHPVWDAIESWKSVMARDLEARIARFDELWRRAEEAKSEGGEKLCLTVHYVEALYDQVICRVSGKPVTPKRREDFRPGVEGKVLLGKYSVITGGTIDEADGVIEFFLKQQQEDFVKLPEAENIGKTSREAETKTEELEKTLRMVVLTPRPIGSCLTCL